MTMFDDLAYIDAHRDDPCDEWPVWCWMNRIFIPLLTEEDRFLARHLRWNVNAQYGKLGGKSAAIADIEASPDQTVIIIDSLSGSFNDMLDAYMSVEDSLKKRDDQISDVGRFLLEDIPQKEACGKPDKGYDYQQHNKQRKRRP